jgi:hypothetical protein
VQVLKLEVQARTPLKYVVSIYLGRCGVDLDVFIITIFCIVEDALDAILKDKRIRERGPNPTILDSEIITMEVVGEFVDSQGNLPLL